MRPFSLSLLVRLTPRRSFQYQDYPYYDPSEPSAASPDEHLAARIEFGTNGEVKRVFDSTFYLGDLPDTLIPDGRPHPAAQPGFTYIAGPYGGQIDSDAGASSFGRLFLGPFEIASASIYVYGVLDGDRWEGTLGYHVEFGDRAAEVYDDPDVSPYTQEFAVYAVRE